MPLTAIEEKHLLNLAEKLGLDTQEIDHELSYYENKAHLEELGHVDRSIDRSGKVNHRVISDKIKKHKKAKKEKTTKVSCAYLMKRCKRAGLSKGKCKVIMPYHCKRRVPMMPEMPSMPGMGSPEKVKAKRYVWRHK